MQKYYRWIKNNSRITIHTLILAPRTHTHYHVSVTSVTRMIPLVFRWSVSTMDVCYIVLCNGQASLSDCVHTKWSIVSVSFCVLTGLNCLAYDEAIIAQQDRIQQEVVPVLWLSSVLFLTVLCNIFGLTPLMTQHKEDIFFLGCNLPLIWAVSWFWFLCTSQQRERELDSHCRKI